MPMHARFVQYSGFAVRIMPRAGTVKRERRRAVRQHRELAVEQRKCSTLFDTGRQDTDTLQSAIRRKPDVIAARVAGPDPRTGAVSYACVVGCTTRHSTIHGVVVEQPGRPATPSSSEPSRYRLDQPVASHCWCTEAAIEEHGIRSSQSPLVWRRTVHDDSRLPQECGKVLSDGGVARVG